MYKVGIIGLGQIAYHIDNDPNRKIIWSHIKAYKNIDKTKITSICDINYDLVEEIKKDCDISKGYINYEKMLEENNFDIISICTPIQTHFDIIKKCIETGVKAIFCEKTLSYSLEEANQIIELRKKNNVVLGVNYILRWDNLNKEIKELIDTGVIGKIYTMVGYGATALHTSTSHLIDLMVYFSNNATPLWIVGEKQEDFIRIVHGEKDYGGIGTIKFSTGVIAFIKGTSLSPFKYMLELDIFGENGRIKLYDNGLSYNSWKSTQTLENAYSKTIH